MAAKTAPPINLAGLDAIPTFPYVGKPLDGDRTIASFLSQALHMGPDPQGQQKQRPDAGDLVARGLLARRILESEKDGTVELSASEYELLEKCVTGSMLPQFGVVLMCHLQDYSSPVLTKDDKGGDKADA